MTINPRPAAYGWIVAVAGVSGLTAAVVAAIFAVLNLNALIPPLALVFFPAAMGVGAGLVVAVSVAASLDLARLDRGNPRARIVALWFLWSFAFVSLGLFVSVFGLLVSGNSSEQDLSALAKVTVVTWAIGVVALAVALARSLPRQKE